MNENSVTLCPNIESGLLAVEFYRLGDRVGHRIVVCESEQQTDQPAPWLESIEGDATDLWPPSPALQEVHTETRADGHRVALLVGQAGSNRYSASFEPGEKLGTIYVDVACRVKSDTGLLASSYRLAGGISFDPQSPVIVDGSGRRCRIQSHSTDGDLGSVSQSEDRVIIGPTDQIDATSRPKRPQTHRWRYVISVE